MIVGHKIEQWMTVEPRQYGAHWEVTTYRRVTELHATKGWRPVRRSRHVQLVRNPPSPRVRQEARFTRFEPARRRRDRALTEFHMTPAARERSLMRHGWYRRQKQKEARAAAAEAWRGS